MISRIMSLVVDCTGLPFLYFINITNWEVTNSSDLHIGALIHYRSGLDTRLCTVLFRTGRLTGGSIQEIHMKYSYQNERILRYQKDNSPVNYFPLRCAVQGDVNHIEVLCLEEGPGREVFLLP